MSYADDAFVRMCEDILENGTNTAGEKVRPKWEGGTPAYALKKFGVVNRYDLRKEFPAITLRRTALKSCFDEILWIWQRKSNNIHFLNSHIWDQWADENGSIGKAYGYQQALLHRYDDVRDDVLEKAFPGASFGISGAEGTKGETAFGYEAETDADGRTVVRRPIAVKKDGFCLMTQFDKVLYDLIDAPFSRRMIVDMWNPEDQHEMSLTPCAYSMTFNVTRGEDGGLVLNAVLNQRSNDLLAAGNWNVCQYALLLMMTARHCSMTAGELVHVIADAHIYDRHVPLVKELIKRERRPAPKVFLNPEKKNFYDFSTEDLIVENYETGEQIRGIPIAE